MRIVGGDFRGVQITAPKGNATRPTTDRLRESLFNMLTHSFDDFSLENVRVLDLFAGSGALSLEALSRGAAFALLVDRDAEARGAQRENIERLRLEGRTRLFRRDALKMGKGRNMGRFGLVFLDPPYGKGLAEKTLAVLHEGDWLEERALCVVEEEAKAEPKWPDEFVPIDKRSHGGSQIIFLHYKG